MTNFNNVNREDRCTTASSMSAIYRNIMESPKPVCNFYFAHPFGIQTPPSLHRSSYSSPTCEFYFGGRNSRRSTNRGSRRRNSQASSKTSGTINRRHTSLIPWPRTTWSREAQLAPLVQLIARQHGRKVPDIEHIIQTVRQAWNTPSSRSLLQSPGETEYTASFWDISNTLHYTYYQMGVGTNAPAPLMAAGPGLLKRRYSVPEIIMRKHSLAQQKHFEDAVQTVLATRVPAKKISVPSYYGSSTTAANSATAMTNGGSGSDSNLSRSYHQPYSNGGGSTNGNVERNVEYSMRKQLLKRLWSKDVKICGRPSSLSPPSRRSTPSRRVSAVSSSHPCEECQKLGVSVTNQTSPKRVRLTQGSKSLDSQPKTEASPRPSEKSDDLRRSVLIYMTSLENGVLEREESQEVLRVEVEGAANQQEKEESADSGNGEATQNLMTSSSEEAENLVNNNVEEEEEEEVPRTPEQDSQKDDENNELQIPSQTVTREEENGNQVEEPVTFRPPSSGSFRIMSQSSNGHIQDVIVHDGSISYFPSYSLVESRGDVSSYTSQCSEPEADPIGAVTSGSAYPDLDYPYQIVVTRLSALPRTVSMEVQPSSTSAEENVEYDSADDDTASLVDSLDDPLSPKMRRKRITTTPRSAEAFFVPIADRPPKSLQVNESMPDKLKERLDSRQKSRDQKKETVQESKKKIRKVQRVIERKVPLKVEPRKAPKPRQTSSSSSTPAPKAAASKPKKNVRKEIGMLESYKIDARGNMQFQNPPEKPPSKTSKKPNGVIDKMEERRKQIMKDVQQMTLYQQADLTPDTEGGPRRMYQKTEIQEGDKRIEILEIVECLDTTPETSPFRPAPKTRTPVSKTSRTRAEASPKVPSKIPVSRPSKTFVRVRSGSSRESSPVNPVKDRAIADLLIEALNNNEASSVEFVASKEYLKPPMRKAPVRKAPSTKRSAHSGKYLTQFEVIPEEKSGMSFDSSTEDPSRAPSIKNADKSSPQSSSKQSSDAQSSEKSKSKPPSRKNSDSDSSSRRNSDTSDRKSDVTVKAKKSESDSDSVKAPVAKKEPEKKPTVAPKKNGLTTKQKEESNNNRNLAVSAFKVVEDDVLNGNFEPLPPPNSRAKTNTPKEEFKPWNGFSKPESPNEDKHTSSVPVSSYLHYHHPPSSFASPHQSSFFHDHHRPSANHTSNLIEPYLPSPITTSTTVRHSLFNSLMSPAAYTNAPTTSCGGGGTAIDVCQNCFPSTSASGESGAGTTGDSNCNIMRIIDQNFRDNPDIFTEDYLKSLRSLAPRTRDSHCSDLPDTPAASNQVVLKVFDRDDEYVDVRKIEEKNLKNSHNREMKLVSTPGDCSCRVFTTTRTQENEWQMSDCKLIQSRVEYFETYQPETESKALFLYKENKVTTAEKKPPTEPPKAGGSPPRSTCSSCCFCNPSLHHEKGVECAFCKSKSPKVPDTPCSIHRYYESLKKTNHTHTRTSSRDSDSVRVKCTRTNEKIRRTILPEELKVPPKPQGVASKTKSGLSRPKDINNLPRVSNVTVEKEVEIVRDRKASTKHKPEIRLPTPETKHRSFDSSSSPCSSASCSPVKTTAITTLPPAHWNHHYPPNSTSTTQIHHQNLISSSNNNPKSSHQLTATTSSRSKHSPASSVDQNMNARPAPSSSGSSTNASNNNSTNPSHNSTNRVNNNHEQVEDQASAAPAPAANSTSCAPSIFTTCNTNVNNNGTVTNTAWSVTVAGNYNNEMAPDVDLRLSFPNKFGAPQTHIVPNLNSNWRKRSSANPINKWGPPQVEPMPLSPTNSIISKAPPALPAAADFNPKRNLIPDHKPNWRKTPPQFLPGVGNNLSDQNLSRNERKGIKSVASVLTATKALGMLTSQRAMSFQSINRANPNQRFFDQATELSQSTCRRASLGSEAPSDMALSVSGARIMAEYKPKVPTMSEKDLTRTKKSSFTRNRMQYQY